MEIKHLLLESLLSANQYKDEGRTDRLIHRNRSSQFVEEFASRLRTEYKDRKGVYVLSKGYELNRRTFGLNELLFDILVCETDVTLNTNGGEPLTFVKGAIWQIESEFSRNSREAIYDFNKLVLGASENKLFIGPQVSNEDEFLKPLLELAKHCNSNTYIALIPHPEKWKISPINVHCWQYLNGWKQL